MLVFEYAIECRIILSSEIVKIDYVQCNKVYFM